MVLPHDIVIFKILFLGNIFGEFPKFKVPETLDFPASLNPSPEINKNGKPKNVFGKTGECVFGKISPKYFIFGKYDFGQSDSFLEKSQQNTGGAYA